MNDYLNVTRLLARETVYSYADVEHAVRMLRALGWEPWQIRRGVLTVARGSLSLDALWRGAELAGDVDRFLDALTPSP